MSIIFNSLSYKEVLRRQGSPLTLIYKSNKLLVPRYFEALGHGCLRKNDRKNISVHHHIKGEDINDSYVQYVFLIIYLNWSALKRSILIGSLSGPIRPPIRLREHVFVHCKQSITK